VGQAGRRLTERVGAVATARGGGLLFDVQRVREAWVLVLSREGVQEGLSETPSLAGRRVQSGGGGGGGGRGGQVGGRLLLLLHQQGLVELALVLLDLLLHVADCTCNLDRKGWDKVNSRTSDGQRQQPWQEVMGYTNKKGSWMTERMKRLGEKIDMRAKGI
jgi:hypothetical protein